MPRKTDPKPRNKVPPRSKAPKAFLIGGKQIVDGNGNMLGTLPKYDIEAASRRVYESFVREAGYKDDARIPNWEDLKTFQQARWRTIAQDVIDAATRVVKPKPSTA